MRLLEGEARRGQRKCAEGLDIGFRVKVLMFAGQDEC